MREKSQAEQKGRLKTLDRVFSKAGMASRSQARRWIEAGKVQVNGQVVRDPEHWVDPERDRIALDGKPLRTAARVYLMLHKPEGYITSRGDPENRPTVYRLIHDAGVWVSPVGRLDLDTSGLLLMTNDNEFADRITSPASHVPKTYRVQASTVLTEDRLQQLRDGVELSDGLTRPAKVTRLRDTSHHTYLEITITEGRNRQVRRMLEAIDSRVQKLERTGIGPLQLGDLPAGKWRRLTEAEIEQLRK